MNKLYFCNPGEIDIRAVTTLGVNVKEGESPIGHFGTGIKYAIAGVLRLGGSISIWSGLTKFQFGSLTADIRGKPFGIVHMWTSSEDHIALGFTTDLGKDWEPWMLYRELRSNALDEGGDLSDHPQGPVEGYTVIEVDCEAITQAHLNRAQFWIDGEPRFEDSLVQCFDLGATNHLFFHRIRATAASQELQQPWAFQWSLKSARLTEDRTLASIYDARSAIAKAILGSDDEELIEACLDGWQEATLDYYWPAVAPSVAFVAVVVDRLKRKVAVPSSARDAVRARHEEVVEAAETEVPDSWYEMLRYAPEEAPRVTESVYSYVQEVEARISGLEEEVKYWRACAEKLAGTGRR